MIGRFCYGPKRGKCIPWTKSLGLVHVIFSWTKWGVFLGPIPVGPNQDYPAGLLRSLLSPMSTWIHHFKNASDTRRVNTPFPLNILYRYGLSNGMMLYNFRNTHPILIIKVLKLTYDFKVNNSYVSTKI